MNPRDIMNFECDCKYCMTNRGSVDRWPPDGRPHTYLWDITESNFYHRIYPSVHTDKVEIRNLKRVYWVEIPKNASFTLYVNISDDRPRAGNFQFYGRGTEGGFPRFFRDDGHIVDKEDLKDFYEGFFIYRNPYDRFRSMVSHYFIDGPRLEQGVKWLKELGIDLWVRGSKDEEGRYDLIADAVLEHMSHINKIEECHHWKSQRYFIPDEVFDTNYKVYGLTWVSSYLQHYTLKDVEYKSNKTDSKKIFLSDDNRKLIEQLYWDDFALGETVKNDIIDFPIPLNYELKRK